MDDVCMDSDSDSEASAHETGIDADLSGIITSVDRLREISLNGNVNLEENEEVTQLLSEIHNLWQTRRPRYVCIGTMNGVMELLINICSNVRSEKVLISALKTLGSIIFDLESTKKFLQSDGPKVIVDILSRSHQNSEVLDGAFNVIKAAATINEIVKESFMDLEVDELILRTAREHKRISEGVYAALHGLLTPDDNRVVVSQVFRFARRFAELGIIDVLINDLKEAQLSSSSLVLACNALKAIAVTDKICRSIYENGGIDASLKIVDECGDGTVEHNDAVAGACSLLSKLARSDVCRAAIIQKGGLDKLNGLLSRFSDNLPEVSSAIWALSSKPPEKPAVEAPRVVDMEEIRRWWKESGY